MATDTIPIEKFWQELAEFKAVVDNYARTHRESTDRDRRKYFESLQDYKGKDSFSYDGLLFIRWTLLYIIR